MSMTSNSTTSERPAKPYDEFPPCHRSGRWAKKICGRTHFFGPWCDWQGLLSRLSGPKGRSGGRPSAQGRTTSQR